MNRQLFNRRIEAATQGGVKPANSLGGRGAGKGPTLLTGQDGSIYRHVLSSPAKLGICVAALALGLAGPQPLAPLTVGACALGLAAWLGQPTLLATLWRSAAVGLLSVALALAMGTAPETAWPLGAHLASRVGCGLAVFGLYSRTTSPESLHRTLQALRVPADLVELLRLAQRYQVVLRDSAVSVREAQTLRLSRLHLQGRLRAMGVWAGATLVKALGQASALAESQAVRTGTLALAPAASPAASPDSAVLEARDVAVGHAQSQPVLSSVAFEVHRGQILALVGANGSGKTTLLRTLAGLLPERHGSVHLGGQLAPRGPTARAQRGLGLTFQNSDDQLFGSTVEEDVAIGPMNQGLKPLEVHARVTEALASTGASALRERPIESLSEGEKKRVCLAGVLAMKPALLLLDEPTAGLDPAAERRTATLLRGLADRLGTAMIVATHAIDLVPHFADHVAVLGDGRLLAWADCATVMTDRATLERAQLRLPLPLQIWRDLGAVGAPPMASVAQPLTCEAMVGALRQLLTSTGRPS